MPHRHYPPAYLRYLRARLWNLGKPSFWGTAIFLSVVGLVIREYWSNPNLFTYKQNKQVTSIQPDKSSLSEEDKAIAADIDNLPALYDGLEQVIPTTATNPKNNSQANKTKSLLEELISKKQSSTDVKSNSGLGTSNNASVAQEKNVFVSQAENLLQLGKLDTGSQLSDVKSLSATSQPTGVAQTPTTQGIGLVSQTNSSQNSNTLSPLDTPINQSVNQTLPSFNGTNSTSPNVFGQTSYNGSSLQTPVTNYLPSQSYTSAPGLNNTTGYIQPNVTNSTLNPYNNLGGSQTLPNQNVPPLTRLNTRTGYIQSVEANPRLNLENYFTGRQTLPSQVQLQPLAQPNTSVAPTNVSPYSTQTNSPNVTTSTSPVGNSIWQQPTQVPQSNFSVPRQIPGQYNGGVQNNGYSY